MFARGYADDMLQVWPSPERRLIEPWLMDNGQMSEVWPLLHHECKACSSQKTSVCANEATVRKQARLWLLDA